MTTPVRWALVVLLAVAVAAPPVVLRAWPASGSALTAAGLADRIRASHDRAWSGEVRTVGGLQVPSVGSFGNVARLVGGTTSLRVWWRDDEDWRVDRTRGSGESDLIRHDDSLVRWTYESRRATTTRYSAIRLPDESDLLPTTLGRRVLSGVRDSELSRLASRRIAGHSAAGLRIVPAEDRSTISHVDLWADQRTGLPLEVRVYADQNPVPVLSTRTTSLDLGTPPADRTRFAFPQGIRVDTTYAIDDAAGANAFAPFTMPSTLVGLPRRGDPAELGAVGIYGRGATTIIAIPLRRHIAFQLYEQLRKTKAAKLTSSGIAVSVGPLSVLLFANRQGAFLLAGTVTPATLVAANPELQVGVVENAQ